jgi:putative membrane protein
MNSPHPQKLFGTTNELAKERNRAAAERTINAWIGNCLTLIGTGVAIDQIFRSLQQRFPEATPQMTETAAHATSMAFIGVGLALLAIALLQHRLIVRSIEQEDYVLLSVSTLNRLVVAGIVLIGIVSFFAIVYLN